MTRPAAGRGGIRVRPARPEDAQGIHELLLPHVRAGIVLPRPASEIRTHAGQFLVAERADDGSLAGCVALRAYGDELREVRSLAVAAGREGQGVGSSLVRAAVDEARRHGARELFALTLRPHLFQRLGFQVVEKSRFPQKVWADCRHCAKKDCCDEVALSIPLS
ncbi:MAG: GNAT family N-acetyltransferase [Lentisphaeria bacterium]